MVSVTAALVVSPGHPNTAMAMEGMGDGGFEAASGDPLNSPAWNESDSVFGSPLCSQAVCNTTSSAHTGSVWAWFGGSATAGQTASLSQSVTIPAGTLSLTYWYSESGSTSPYDATLDVEIDGVPYRTHHETSSTSAYAEQQITIGGYADGGTHTIAFEFVNPSAGVVSMNVDDVSLVVHPDTELTTAPAGGVAKALTVPFAFSSNAQGASFRCSIDGAGMAPCTSPTVLTLAAGPHTFAVAAEDTAGADETPASVHFTAYDCSALDRAADSRAAKVTSTQKRVVRTRHRLRAAIKAGRDPKARQLRRKYRRLEKKLKKALEHLASAQDGDRPCRT